MRTAQQAAQAWSVASKQASFNYAQAIDPVESARYAYLKGWITVEELEARLDRAFGL